MTTLNTTRSHSHPTAREVKRLMFRVLETVQPYYSNSIDRSNSAPIRDLGHQRKGEQGEARGQHQGPHAGSRKARRTKAGAGCETDDRRPCALRSAASPGYLCRIIPEQYLADI